MRRRDSISLLGTTAAAWPFAARAHQPTMPAIGFLDSRSPEAVVSRLRAFRQGLQESGYVEGENVAIVYRYAAGGPGYSILASVDKLRDMPVQNG